MKAGYSASLLTDTGVAFVLLTRWPMPRLPDKAFVQSSRAVWAFPLVGAAIGALGYAVAQIAVALGFSYVIASGLLLAAWMLSSGAMHEDGLADLADGFWGGRNTDDRLAIMKDSQIGTYGTLTLVVTVGLRWSALSVLLAAAPISIIACATLSRAMMPVVMHLLPSARQQGLSQSVGRPTLTPVAVGLSFALLISVATIGAPAVGAIVAAAILTVLVMVLARSKIGGQTGDVLGATQQISELAALLFCVALLA